MVKNRPALFRGRYFADEIIVLCDRWYLRFSLSYRDLEEIMAERNLSVDHTTVWRWVQRYAPELNRRVRRELKPTGGSTGATIDFYLSGSRDAAAAKQFLGNALAAANYPHSRVINVDGNQSYPKVVEELKKERRLGRRCRCRTFPYLNNIVEQNHREIKRRVNAKQGSRSILRRRRRST